MAMIVSPVELTVSVLVLLDDKRLSTRILEILEARTLRG